MVLLGFPWFSLVLLGFQPASAWFSACYPINWANYKTVPNIKLQTACMSFKFRARDMGDLPKYAVFYVESHCDLKNAP